MIPYGKQHISDEDIQTVVDVLKSDFITQGPSIKAFEDAVANHVGAEYALACNSATSALHIACLSLEVGPNDLVWTSPNSFVASANCALYCGADVDFVDIDSTTGNMSVTALKQKLESAEQLPKVVIPVHFAGQSCDMEDIAKLAKQYGFKIIEDASHAIGGKYQDTFVGQCQYSDICIFSFHPVKIITTAEGGMALTQNAKLAEKLSLYRSHSVTRDESLMTSAAHDEGPWYYQQVDLGFNYRITDLQAALGLSQLNKLDDFVAKRNERASYYRQQFSHPNIECLQVNQQCLSAYHLFVIKVPTHVRKQLFIELREKEIGVNVHYIPIHTQPYYQKLGFKLGDFEQAEQYYQSCISLPLYPDLTTEQQDYIVETIETLLCKLV